MRQNIITKYRLSCYYRCRNESGRSNHKYHFVALLLAISVMPIVMWLMKKGVPKAL